MTKEKKETEQEVVASGQEAVTKVTTGAWWKSRVEETADLQAVAALTPSGAEKESGTEKPPAAKKKPAARKKPATRKQAVSEPEATVEKESVAKQEPVAKKKPAARKKPAVKKKPAVDAEPLGGESSAAEQTDASGSPAAPEPKKAGGRKRAPRKPAASKKSSVEEVLAAEPTELVAVEGGEGEADSNEEKKAPAKRSRGRRGRGRRKKPVVDVAEAGTDLQDDAVQGEGVGPESTASGQTVDQQSGQESSSANSGQTTSTGPGDRTRPARPRKARSSRADRSQAKDQDLDSVMDDDETPVQKDGKGPVLKLLINAEEPEECRIALLEDGRLESIFVSTVSREHTKSNIYKARIVAIESNLQAAFVDYGTEKNGFLSFNEIHPEYYRQEISAENRKLIEQHQWKKLNIKDVLERGQELLVQVVKEEVSTKGANMTTYLSLPGRSVVLMPGSDSSGISRKISGEGRRSELREIMESLEIPEGIGWIVRTASVDINKTVLNKDVRYLLKLWQEIKKKGQTMDGVGLIYQDHDCVLRFLREHFDPEIKEILVDDLAAYEKVNDFVEMLPPKQQTVKIRLHKGARPIFNQFNVEDQIESIYQSQVSLPSGGSIVINPTEALVAIDVNSGSTGKGKNFEDAIFMANMEAASELARQLRLRDLGGLVVVDFIDMRSSKNIREVERQVKVAMKRDKAKVDMSRISKFGLMQISRQKLGAPIEALTYRVCEHCNGRGAVRSIETLALFYLRQIQTGASRKHVAQVECRLPLDVAQYLLNNKRNELQELESKYLTLVTIVAEPAMKPADHEVIFHKEKKGPRKENGLEESGELGYIDATNIKHQ